MQNDDVIRKFEEALTKQKRKIVELVINSENLETALGLLKTGQFSEADKKVADSKLDEN